MDGIRDGIKFARFCNQGGEKSGDKNGTSGKATRKTNWEMKARNTRITVTPQIAVLRIGAQTDIWKDKDESDLMDLTKIICKEYIVLNLNVELLKNPF